MLIVSVLASPSLAEDFLERFEQTPSRFPRVESEASSDTTRTADENVIPAAFEAAPATGDLAKRVSEIEAQLKKSADAERKKKADDAKRPSYKLAMQLQADAYLSNQEQANKNTVGDIPNGSAFRRARFGFSGDYGVFDYRIEMDFALPGRPSFLDVTVGMNELPCVGHVRIGHFFEPFSMERLTRNRFLTFMERALPDQPFAPARNLGAMIYNWSDDQMTTWALGSFYVNSDVWGDAVGDSHGQSVTGRMTRLLWYDEPSDGRYWCHVGGGYSFRGSDHKRVRFRAQPEARLGSAVPNIPFVVDTGDIAANFNQLINAELALVYGPWSASAEYFWVPVDRINAPNPTFHGWYAQTSYFLTGEHRPYNRKDGTFDRVYPFEDFFRVSTPTGICTGAGAWEAAVRISQLDLNSRGVAGGMVTDLTVGLNWYMNPWTRLTTDWVHSFLDRAPGGKSNADLWGIRMGFEY